MQKSVVIAIFSIIDNYRVRQPNYDVSSSMGWRQSMGMQNPGMGYGMMPMYPMYGQYEMQPGMIVTGYGMNPGMQFQRPQ